MKKLIVISIIFSAVVGLAVFEMVYSTRLYNDLHDGLIAVSNSIAENKDNLDNPETVKLMNDVMKRWRGSKELLFMLGNTTLLRSVDEHLIILEVMIQTNHPDDAPIAAATAKALIRAVLNDTHPVPSNLF